MDALTAAMLVFEEHRASLRGDMGDPGKDGRDGFDGSPGLQGDPGLVWRGPWKSGNRYVSGDAVEHDGSSYIATGSTRDKPPKGAWDLIARKGQQGDPGLPGRRGLSGSGGEGGGAVASVNGQTGVVVLAASDVGALTSAAGNAAYDAIGAASTAQAAAISTASSDATTKANAAQAAAIAAVTTTSIGATTHAQVLARTLGA